MFIAEQPGPMREATTFRRHAAGAEMNVAVGVCRLGRTAGWIGRVGDDELGASILYRLRGEGVDVSRAQVDAGAPTGVLIRERRDVGPLEVLYYRRGSAASRMTTADLDADYLGSAGVLHLTGITPALSDSCRETVFAAAEIARTARVPIALDPNMRRKLWSEHEAKAVLCDLVSRSDVVLPGLDEAEMLTGESDPEKAARGLQTLGPRRVVVKLGQRGALAVEDDAAVHVPAAPIARVVDPVGAGDAFAAGYHAAQARGLSFVECVRVATRSGSLACTVPGDLEGLPRWEEVLAEAGADVRR